MSQTIPHTMRAVAIDRFGGPDELKLQTLPVPEVGQDEVLIRVETAGVGQWDPFEREGGYAAVLGTEPSFPYVLGSEAAGVVAAVGNRVGRFEEGDEVYVAGFLNPKGGFYAQYAAADAGVVSHRPSQLTMEQAGVMSGVSVTALRGLDDVLGIRAGESVAVLGASGGVGHAGVQLAKRRGARVLAIASGNDGMQLVEHLGADETADGRSNDISETVGSFAPGGLDAALILAGGDVATEVILSLRDGGRAAYPSGVQPEPEARSGFQVQVYYGEPDREIIERLDRLIGSEPFEVHVARSFAMDQAAEAHRALNEHYLGKLALQVD
jgi:NADPH2:quinone reductase